MGMLVSMGGLIFGYDTGQISGFLTMRNFLAHLADRTNAAGQPSFSNVRSGTIVGLLSIGTLLGALIAAPISDRFGRKYTIVLSAAIYMIGVVVQITSTSHWYQVALGRWVGGIGVGALSVLVPVYQAETAPRQARGALVSAYQLFITLGILLAYCINYGTEGIDSPTSWRTTMGIGFIWPSIMAVGMLFLRESPRWDFRHGNIDAARTTIAKSYGVPESHPEVVREVREIQEKLMPSQQAAGNIHVFASIGSFAIDQDTPENTPDVGAAMIVFACLFIAGFAMTWGPISWTLLSNFYVAFATPFITEEINYRYGYVFASCCFAGAVIVYFFVPETQGRSLEEIDTMFVLGVNPRKSKHWKPPAGEGLTSLDNTYWCEGD
ncbi:hexose transporter hxt5 [Coniosporium tulheliwenetii]|uniref:Hexose transporter hxt5 n=1 Tax=Coniosporium tulheliwenetii TaxID=3383036 RepID=A0ACC2Z481_9PEZI|nr:hexose transporter hxt5 [Cladosporium sp. JES 115]